MAPIHPSLFSSDRKFLLWKLPLKSHWPGDSSRIERRVKNGEKEVRLLHISPLAKGTVRIRIPLFIFQRLSIFWCKMCWTKDNFKEVLFSPINGFPRWENSDCLIAVPLALVWTQITRSLLSGSLLSLSLIEVKFTYIKFAIVKCTIQWLEYIHNVVHITFIYFQDIFITQKETPCLSPFLLPLVPGNHESVFCLWIYSFWIFHINGTM